MLAHLRDFGARWRRWVPLVAACGVTMALAHLGDRRVFELFARGTRLGEIGRTADWKLALRLLGYLPVWWIVAVTTWREAAPQTPRRVRAAELFSLPTLTVLAVEVAKLAVRRYRPNGTGGAYRFSPREHWGNLSSAKLGFPSSHAAVGFAAAMILARLCPSLRYLWFALALGCAATRVAGGHHFLSDVAGSFWVALAVVKLGSVAGETWRQRRASGGANAAATAQS